MQKAMEQNPLRRLSFHYTPLDPSVDCVRLLALFPYDKRDPEHIECELRTVTFSEKPKYEALSYTWGDSKPTQTIWVDGRPFSMHENLYNALYNLRPTTGRQPRMLWADAICIDQDNLDERKRRVGLMDYIYTRASTVLIWLGRGNAKVQKGYSEVYKAFKLPEYPGDSEQRSWDKHLDLCKSWQRWVYRRSYWEKHKQSLNFEHEYEYDLIHKLDEKRKGRHGSDNRLEKLLGDFQYAACKDKRDEVYELLGLAYDCQDGSIEPDYTKPLFSLYTDVLTWFCYLRILPVANPEAAEHIATHAYDRGMRIVRFSHLVQSLLGFPLCPEIVTEDLFFAVAAVGGTVLHLGPTYEEMYSSSVLYKDWRLSFDAHYSSPSERLKPREINKVYDAFLLKHSEWISHGVFGIDPQQMYSSAKFLEYSWEDAEAEWTSREISGLTRRRSSSDIPAISYRSKRSSRPRMFLGSNLLLGSAPANAREGDLICLFWNIGIVALLRKEDGLSEFQKYRVIGKLYLSTG